MEAPKSAEPAESLDELVVELGRAQDQLDAELGPPSERAREHAGDGAEGSRSAEEEMKDADQPAPPKLDAAPPAPEPKAATEQPGGEGDDRRRACGSACKALGSMRRSAERICELAGPEHERCNWANARVADATERVARAGCRCGEG